MSKASGNHESITDTPALQKPSEYITGLEDENQIDLVPEFSPCGFKSKVTALDVFSRYLFAYSIASQDAMTVARVIFNIMTKHAYLVKTIISDKRSASASQITKYLADRPGISLDYAMTKDAQITGVLERKHTSLPKAVEFETGEQKPRWHKNDKNYNSSYHTSIGCELGWVFPKRASYNVIVPKMGFRL